MMAGEPHQANGERGSTVASKSSRQRKLERARTERRIARQAQHTRRRRQAQAAVAAGLAVVVIVLGVVWLVGGFDNKPATPAADATATSCTWVPKATSSSTSTTSPDTPTSATPPTTGILRSGFETMTIQTDLGDIEARLDLSKAPCTAASFRYLGEQKFLDGTSCHRLNTTTKTLTCGDPTGDGTGGPAYQFADEDVPTTPLPSVSPSPEASAPAVDTYYAKGTIVLANTGAGTNGSQFSIVYGDASTLPATYSVVGTVTKGLDLVEAVGRDGAVDGQGQPAAEGRPKSPVAVKSLTVGTPTVPPAAPETSTSAAPPAP